MSVRYSNTCEHYSIDKQCGLELYQNYVKLRTAGDVLQMAAKSRLVPLLQNAAMLLPKPEERQQAFTNATTHSAQYLRRLSYSSKAVTVNQSKSERIQVFKAV